MPNNAVNSPGSKVSWAVETVAGTRPTTGFKQLKGVTAVPPIANDLPTHDVTPIDAANRHYIMALPDPGGTIGLTVNDAKDFRDSFDEMKTAYDALADGKRLWIQISYPSGSELDSFFFPADTGDLGFGGIDVDTPLGNTLNFAVTGDFTWATAVDPT